MAEIIFNPLLEQGFQFLSEGGSSGSTLQLPSYTTAARDNLTPAVGYRIFNTDIKEIQIYYDSKWHTLFSGDYEEAYIWEGTLNNADTNILALNENRPDFIKFKKAGIISAIEIDIENLGSNPNSPTSIAVNFKIGSNSLLASNLILTAGLNTITILQNATFNKNDILEMHVIEPPGAYDHSGVYLTVYYR